MTTADIAIIVTGSVLLYSVLAGVSWQLAGAHWNDPGPFLFGLLWPIMLPMLLGARLARRLLAREPSIPKAQVRP